MTDMDNVTTWLRGVDKLDADIVQHMVAKVAKALMDGGTLMLPETMMALVRAQAMVMGGTMAFESDVEVRQRCREWGKALAGEVLVFRAAAQRDGITR